MRYEDKLKKVEKKISKEALWLVYNKRCGYSSVDLQLEDVTLDHIIPKSICNTKEKQDELKHKFSLPDDFDFEGLDNIIPCSEYHNRINKKNLLFAEHNIRFFIEIARSKIREYNKINNDLENRDSVKELCELLKNFEGDIEEVIHYINGDFNIDFFSPGYKINKKEIDTFLNEIMFEEGVELERKTNKESLEIITVKSCNEYMKAKKAGYYANNNWGIKFSCQLENKYIILNSLKHAVPVYQSHMHKHGIFSLFNIPTSFFPSQTGENYYSEFNSYAEAINNGVFKICDISKKSIVISCGGMNHKIEEVFRADFNNDGKEEILIYSHETVDNATWSYGGASFITLDDDTNMFKHIEIEWEL